MKLDRKTYEEIRSDLRQQLSRKVRMNAPSYELNALQRRIARLDMSWTRGVEWNDITPGDIIEQV